jgi:Tfp pilus assembly protein PilX
VNSGVIIFLELTLVLGLALFFGVRELRNMRRYDRERAERARAAQQAETAAAEPLPSHDGTGPRESKHR